MRRDSGVGRWKFEELCHRVRTLGNGRRSNTEEIHFLDVAITQHGHSPLIDTSPLQFASRAMRTPIDALLSNLRQFVWLRSANPNVVTPHGNGHLLSCQ